jgi:hypothetical protein
LAEGFSTAAPPPPDDGSGLTAGGDEGSGVTAGGDDGAALTAGRAGSGDLPAHAPASKTAATTIARIGNVAISGEDETASVLSNA